MKIASKLPEGDRNGLTVVARAMVDDPHATHVVLAVLDCSRLTTDTDTGDVIPTARIRRVEVLLADDKQPAEQLMRRAMDARMGGTVLPLELEDELTSLFGSGVQLDPATGELSIGDEDSGPGNGETA